MLTSPNTLRQRLAARIVGTMMSAHHALNALLARNRLWRAEQLAAMLHLHHTVTVVEDLRPHRWCFTTLADLGLRAPGRHRSQMVVVFESEEYIAFEFVERVSVSDGALVAGEFAHTAGKPRRGFIADPRRKLSERERADLVARTRDLIESNRDEPPAALHR